MKNRTFYSVYNTHNKNYNIIRLFNSMTGWEFSWFMKYLFTNTFSLVDHKFLFSITLWFMA